MINSASITSKNDTIHLKEVFFKYATYWKWYILSFLICISCAFIYFKFSIPQYNVFASILVKDAEKGNLSNQLTSFNEMGLDLGGVQSKLENEIEILKSRTILSNVVQELKTNISYYDASGIVNKEIYENTIIKVNFIGGDSSIYNREGAFSVKIISPFTFQLEDKSTKKNSIQKFGDKITTSLGQLIIVPVSSNNRSFVSKKIEFTVNKFDKVVDFYRSSIVVEPTNNECSAITISMKVNNMEKGKAIINCLINQHKDDAIQDKNLVGKNTLDFINERLEYLTKELSNVENSVSTFKSNNKIFDLTTNAELFFENESENQQKLLENTTQLKLAEYIYDHVASNKKGELVPSNIGITNLSIEKMIETVNSLQLERNRLITNSSDRNPIIINLDTQIESVKRNLKESLSNQKNSLKIANRELIRQNNELSNKLSSAPRQEKDFKEIARQQQVKEALYLYLLQKREETSLSLAITVSNSKIIDEAYSDGNKTGPKKSLVIIISILLSIGLTTIIIYILQLLDSKIHSKSDFMNLGIPYIGDIPVSERKNKLVVGKTERSSVAEAFRLLRTNINFLIPSSKNGAKSIFITSTLSNEGKSFISLNLAATLGLSGKKVALIGLDLRAPKILQYINEKKSIGITSFIINSNTTLNDICIQIPENENLTIIPSGPIPPNPAELLMTDRLNDLFDELKTKFDYLVVDTAPVGLVADSLLLNKYADMFIYVARANFLDKKLLNIAQNLHDEGKLRNMSLLLNCSDYKRNYGYGYSYGYGDDSSYIEKNEKSWFQKIWKK